MRYALLLLLLVGCAKPPVVVTAPCPKPPVIVAPILRVKSLTPGSTISEVLKAYTLDLAEQVGYSQQLESLLSAYE